MTRRIGLGWIAAMMAVLLPVCTAAGQQSEPSAYRTLDKEELANTLADLAMAELLEKLISQMPDADTTVVKSLLAKTKIAQANMTTDEGAKMRLLDEAIELLKDVAASLSEPQTNDELLRFYRIQADLTDAVLARVEPASQRLLWLRGGPEERQTVRTYTDDVVSHADDIYREMEQVLQDWRTDLVKRATIVPELEDLARTLQFQLAWLRFYRAVALDPGAARQQLLSDTLNALMLIVQATDPGSGARLASMQLRGMAARERAKNARDDAEANALHDEAVQSLQGVVESPAAAGWTRAQSLFESIKNLIEWGRWSDAEQQVDAFAPRVAADDMLGPGNAVEADLYATLLENYLYETRAAATADADAAEQHRLRAQQALLDFLDARGDEEGVEPVFMRIIAKRYAGRTDYENLSSLVLAAMASDKRRGATATATYDETELQRAAELLDTVLAREDKVTEQVRPLALWEKGLVQNALRDNLQAGDAFATLAEKYPDDRNAFDAAVYAAVSYDGIADERERKGKTVGTELRETMVRALEILLERWGERDRAIPWFFDLGLHYDKLAEVSLNAGETDQAALRMNRAIAAYENVPPPREKLDLTLRDHLYARHLALELRVRLLELADGEHSPTDPAAVLDMLKKYVSDAAAAAGRADDSQLAATLREWAAWSRYRRAQVLHEQLNRPDEALTVLESIPADFPKTDSVQDALATQIRWLLRDQTSEAIAKLQQFRQEYPDKAGPLIQRTVLQVRRRIRELSGQEASTAELERYRDVYLEFAGLLFEQAGADDALAPDEMYAYRQMYAEALLVNDRAADALGQFQQCAQYNQQQRDKQIAQLRERIEGLIDRVDAAGSDVSALQREYDRYIAELRGYGLDPADSQRARVAGEALKVLLGSEGERAIAESADVLRRRLKEGYDRLLERLRFAVPIDATNVRGLARAHRALGNYPQAVEQYNRLVAGIDATENPSLFWQTQLELARCLLEGYRDNASQMNRLKMRIIQLGEQDAEMGGYQGEFNAIRRQAERAAGQ